MRMIINVNSIANDSQLKAEGKFIITFLSAKPLKLAKK